MCTISIVYESDIEGFYCSHLKVPLASTLATSALGVLLSGGGGGRGRGARRVQCVAYAAHPPVHMSFVYRFVHRQRCR